MLTACGWPTISQVCCLILFYIKFLVFNKSYSRLSIDLLDGSLNTGLLYGDATVPPDRYAWTGTTSSGDYAMFSSCTYWSVKDGGFGDGRSGRVLDPVKWTDDGLRACRLQQHLICVSNYMVRAFIVFFSSVTMYCGV